MLEDKAASSMCLLQNCYQIQIDCSLDINFVKIVIITVLYWYITYSSLILWSVNILLIIVLSINNFNYVWRWGWGHFIFTPIWMAFSASYSEITSRKGAGFCPRQVQVRLTFIVWPCAHPCWAYWYWCRSVDIPIYKILKCPHPLNLEAV